jgi:N-methylhydantoinase A
MAYNVAVDVGGTFTDVLVFDEEKGELTLEKVLSTPENQSIGVVNGIELACRKLGISFQDLRLFFHGTTVVTNLLLESRGARVGLLTTQGHEQLLYLARAWTPGPLYGWMGMQRPEPLADIPDTRGIVERIGADGQVVIPLDEEDLRRKVRELVDRGIESLAITFLNSYLNPLHERRARDIVAELYPDLPVSISSDMAQEYGEYERGLTTVVNTYAKPRVQAYLGGLEERAAARGFRGTLNIVRSDGGTMSARAAAERPVHIALSGPSGGAIGTAYLARTIGLRNVLALDMGGTSTDVSMVLDGEPTVRREVRLGYYEFKSPAVDVHSVGAGGGSIAHVSITGGLLVGPMSAGAVPGPAAYGRGGEEPTVTDANVVLHRLPPSVRLGGSLALDEGKARAAVEKVAKALGLPLVEAAQGIIDIVNENMYAALRVVSVERGHDPRDFGLVAFGGAGPMHANALGRLIHSFPVIIPRTPGVMSAFGFLSSSIQNEFAQTDLRIAEETSGAALAESFAALAEEARAWLASEGVAPEKTSLDLLVDLRYYLQNIQVPCRVDLEDLPRYPDCSFLRAAFEAEHQRRYGFVLDAPLEMATLRVIARGEIRGVELRRSTRPRMDRREAMIAEEEVYFAGEWLKTPLYDRARLTPGTVVPGPAIVIQEDTTTVIEPGYRGTIDDFENILITAEVK